MKRAKLNNGRARPNVCHCCGNELDAWTATTEGKRVRPKPQDLNICAYCGEIAIFTDRMRFRPPTADELASIKRIPEIWRVVEAIRELRTKRSQIELPALDRLDIWQGGPPPAPFLGQERKPPPKLSDLQAPLAVLAKPPKPAPLPIAPDDGFAAWNAQHGTYVNRFRK